MHGLFVFLVDRCFHIMTGNTKFHRVGGFNRGIKPTPENDTQRHKHDDGEQ